MSVEPGFFARHKMLSTGAILMLAVFGWVGYLYATYIDLMIDRGGLYELSIGMSKREAFDRLEAAFYSVEGGTGSAFLEMPVNPAANGEPRDKVALKLAQFEKSDEVFEFLRRHDQWDFFLENSYRDGLRLTFCGEKLCQIYRHRMHFELP